ncbi:hypothetical protein G7K_3761-t1 [Saitoella complicata NRRL Y-17804]|uniref:methylmalonate-semialdehyde dehydrogenase (CoA acylating) n=2 Tax=Saitoella complicata (strain BCRC 22490 / CBS 7301 / JCM 7358 / NBRC 10748 / NRRL Y-17804) TaxID=698492 RepID=A0A0E9NIB3_SAICN|nr:hypothetical protein G7K_3761-t1 [Saitoella complicata NRRL Y-17804]
MATRSIALRRLLNTRPLASATLRTVSRRSQQSRSISSTMPSQGAVPQPSAGTAGISYPMDHFSLDQPTSTKNFLNNQMVESKTDKWIDVNDPATQQVVTRVPETTSEELKAAVDSAQKAFPEWRNTSIIKRQQIMFNLVHLIRKNMDRLAASITLEQGKTFADAKGDVLRGLQVVESCVNIQSLMGESVEVSTDMDTYTMREPLGVVAAIAPFNFPAMIPLWCLPVAVVTGNCLVLKPSERDPGAAMIIAELAKEAGLPAGVFNIVHGTHKTVDFILDEPRIKAISFVGSDKAGEYIYRRGTANGKRVQANLGAKNHGVLMPDANKNHALNALAGAAFGAAGQRCMALSTLVCVGEAKNWLPDLVERAKALKVTGGFEQGADLGPVISPHAKTRIEGLIQSGVDEGAELMLDGRGYKPDKYPKGNWIAPTILGGVRTDMQCYQQEVFGPVLVCLNVDTLDDAIELINNNKYGNGTAIFTQSGATARRFQKDIEAGQVGINVPIPVPLPLFSFTGNKGSILGDLNFYGKGGVQFYTQLKTVTALWKHEDAVATRANVEMPTHN